MDYDRGISFTYSATKVKSVLSVGRFADSCGGSGVEGFRVLGLLKGAWDVVSRVRSPLRRVILNNDLLTTLLTKSHEPLSRSLTWGCKSPKRGYLYLNNLTY